MKGNLFIISSPSGGGKGTLIREVLNTVENVTYSVSFTSREMREGEVNGKDYNFVSEKNFQNFADQDLLEYAKVHGNYYGTSRRLVEIGIDAGKDVILEIDVQGAEIVRDKSPDAVSIFILPPSFEDLKSRLEARNTETLEALTVRLNNAKEEVKAVHSFDYVVVNDDISKASSDLIKIFRSERLKRDRQTNVIRDILDSFE